MFQQKLREHFDKTLLTYRDGNYTGGSILRRVNTYVKVFKELMVSKGTIVGIHTDNPMHASALVMACMCHGIDFAIFDYKDNNTDVLTKMAVTGQNSYSWLLFSEDKVEMFYDNIMTINPLTLKVVKKGIAYKQYPKEVREEFDVIFDSFPRIFKDEPRLSKKVIKIPNNYLLKENSKLVGIVYHNGISKSVYNASKISHNSIYKGIRDVIEHDEYKPIGPVLSIESNDQLYNLLNGILIPILQGTRVYYKNESEYYNIVEAFRFKDVKTLYIGSVKLEQLLRVLEKDAIPLLRIFLFKPLLHIFIKKRFNNIFSSNLKHIIIHGKVIRRDLVNATGKSFISLYTMTEIATFVAYRSCKTIHKHLGLIVRKDVQISIEQDGKDNMGEIIVKAPDMLVGYLTRQHTLDMLLEKGNLGKLTTGDIGYLKNEKLFIISKATQLFSNEQGFLIETEKITKLAQNFVFVKSAHVINVRNKIVLVIEPDFDVIENQQLSPASVLNRVESIKRFVNKKVQSHSKIHEVTLYENPDGLPRKNFKIISRYFG